MLVWVPTFGSIGIADDYDTDEDIRSELVKKRMMLENIEMEQEIKFLNHTKVYGNEDLVDNIRRSLNFFKYVKDTEKVNIKLHTLKNFLINFVE